jgi:hypothetical protein
VRAHAAWALHVIASPGAAAALRERTTLESESMVKAEPAFQNAHHHTPRP